jgi:hypothetical protein
MCIKKGRDCFFNNKIKTFTALTILLLSVNVAAQNTMYIPDVSGNANYPNEPSPQMTPTTGAFAVNELHMLPDSGRSGYPISITFTINNTDQFVAFQFDMILPSVLTFIEDSVWLFRKTNHIIIANLVNQQTLRILAYSPSNQPFIGNEGEIVTVMFDLIGTSGTYDIGLNNVVISNSVGVNILTAYYSSYVKIISPDISGQTNLDFGEISVLDTISYDYQLNNTGNDTLIVTDFFSSEVYFWNDTPLPQNIPPGASKTFNLKFHNINKGQYSAIYTIRSNDPDEDPFYVDAAASSFAPNYMLIQNAEAFVADTVMLKIDVNNYEQFIDFQVDLDFPDSLTYISNSATLTDRKQDHLLFEALLTPNKIRLFTFSLNQLPFLGDSGTIVTMNFVVGNDTGNFPLHLSGARLSDSNSQNIIKGTIDGEIYIKPIPTFPLTVTVADGWNMVSVPGINPDGQGIDNWWINRVGNVYKFGGGYVSVATTTPGEGYWMKNNGAQKYNTGDEWPAGGIQIVTHDPIAGVLGWNLIGPYEEQVIADAAHVTSNPSGKVIFPIYKYSGGYSVAATLDPGYAYWVKLSAAAQIILLGGPLAKGSAEVECFAEDWGRIVLTDASGVNYTLYAVKGEVDLNQYELPPAPPTGMFDIRFSSGRIAEDLNSAIQTIEMSGIVHPVRVRVENMSITLQDESGKEINVELKPGEEVTINNISINKLLVLSGELIAPIDYALEQNYPNPFNPSTTIKFSVPEATNVTLAIYNTLGQKVTELVNTKLEAGRYSYQWDARNVATGMYIYELRTDKFVSTKKMILLK